MATRKCPSCGQRYNGKRCGNCLYEPFGNEIRTSFDLHREPDAPRPRSAPARRNTMPRTQPSGAGKKLGLIFGISFVIIFLSVTMGVLIAAFESIGASYEEVWAEPEPIDMPADGLVLYEDEELLVLADCDGSSPIAGDIPIFVENRGDREVVVCTNGVAVNGCMVDDVFFYCEAAPGATSMGTLWIDMETLREMGIVTILKIQMLMDIYDADSYDSIVSACPLEITTDWDGPHVQAMDDSGDIFYSQEGLTLIYQGWEVDEYGDYRLRFYAENGTGRYLELSSSELLFDGQESGHYLWQSFFPDTRAVIYVNLYGLDTLEETELVEFSIYTVLDGDWNTQTESETLTLILN